MADRSVRRRSRKTDPQVSADIEIRIKIKVLGTSNHTIDRWVDGRIDQIQTHMLARPPSGVEVPRIHAEWNILSGMDAGGTASIQIR